jgi:aminoglycoside phosphotransferase (APT) family kinase protein
LIHGDIKWENVIIQPRDPENSEQNLRLIDWETADLGDAAWDVGGALQSYLSFWVFSMPVTSEAKAPELVEHAKLPLEAMQPSIRRFWKMYVDSMQLTGAAAAEWLERSIKFAAARMIQTAYEYMYYSPQLTPSAVYLLQVSLNILTNPTRAISDLLNL